jgi:hypothetical protein
LAVAFIWTLPVFSSYAISIPVYSYTYEWPALTYVEVNGPLDHYKYYIDDPISIEIMTLVPFSPSPYNQSPNVRFNVTLPEKLFCRSFTGEPYFSQLYIRDVDDNGLPVIWDLWLHYGNPCVPYADLGEIRSIGSLLGCKDSLWGLSFIAHKAGVTAEGIGIGSWQMRTYECNPPSVPVPEPSTFILFAIGVLGVLGVFASRKIKVPLPKEVTKQ